MPEPTMLLLKPPGYAPPIQTLAGRAPAVSLPSIRREEHLLSIRFQRVLTKQACSGLPTTYSRLLQSLGVAEGFEAASFRKPLERLMEEDAWADRPFLVALAISARAGGRPAPWFFEKARKIGRYTADTIDDLEAFAFHANELQRAVSYYRGWSTTGCANSTKQGAGKMLMAKDVMTGDVISVQADSTVRAVADVLVTQGISAVPVLDKDCLIGIVSEGDLVRRCEIGTETRPRSWLARLFRSNTSLADKYTREHSTRISDLMTRDVATVAEVTPLADIADLLEKRRIKRVPVMRHGKVVGIVSRANIIRALAITANLPPDTERSDDSIILDHIKEALSDESWPSSGAVNFTVRDGIVSFWGTVQSEEERKASLVLCENVPGVRRVEDHRVLLSFPAVAV
jgi:CBS domain-containing protein